MNAQVRLVKELPAQGRVNRYPVHNFLARQKPFQIVPICIAPVIPGETMKNALIQARAIGPAMKSPVLGAWLEHHLFYVRLRDLASWPALRASLMDASVDMPVEAAAAVAWNRYAGSVNFVKECYDAVVNEFFRAENESVATGVIGDYAVAAVNNSGILDSAIRASDVTALNPGEDHLPGEIPENIRDELSPEFDPHYAAWAKMVAMGATDLDYDDYLASYGIAKPKIEVEQESSKPELLRYLRDWKLPSNIADASGLVRSAHVWDVQERVDKARFFKEPGFILGVSVMRPKVYLSKQGGAAVGMLANALQWLPKALETAEFTALKQFAAGAGPLVGQADGYWVDVRDLFVHGDQMLTNVNLSATDAGLVALPTAAMQKRYVAQADIDGLVATVGTDLLTQDGQVRFTIAGRVRDPS